MPAQAMNFTGSFKIISNPSSSDLARLDRVCFHRPWEPSAFHSLLQTPTVWAWMLADEERSVGFICCQQTSQEAEVLRIGIIPEAGGKGLGRKLMSAMLEHIAAAGIKKVFLEVREGNTPARRLYEGCGFRQIGHRARYYNDPREDAIAYQWLRQETEI